MTKTDHLKRAKEAARIAESDDSQHEAWIVTQIELRGARDAGATQRESAKFMGHGVSWISAVLFWDPRTAPSPFSEAADPRPSTRYERQVPKIARENPELIVAAIKAAPTETQEAIAEAMARDEVLAVPVATAAVKVSNELGEMEFAVRALDFATSHIPSEPEVAEMSGPSRTEVIR